MKGYIPGDESCKCFGILVEVPGGRGTPRSGDPVIGESGDRKTGNPYAKLGCPGIHGGGRGRIGWSGDRGIG